MTLDYLDFEIEIGLPVGQEYPVSLLQSPAGEARGIMHWPYSELGLEKRLKDLQIALLSSGGVRRTVLTLAEAAVQSFGTELFDLLFTGDVRNRYDVSQERAYYQAKGLRVKLRIQDPRLANLPWEFLYDPRSDEYISLSQHTPLVRYLELPQTIRPLAVTLPLRILAMVASPKDLQPLDVRVEQERLNQAIGPLQAQGLVQLRWLEGATWRDLQRAVRREAWHIFHFVGHGDFDPRREEGLIALCDNDGKAHLLTASDLGRLLADHRTLRLAVLNACLGAQGNNRDLFASTAATLVRRGILAVVAMQQAITDTAAIEFTQTFYEGLADGLPVDAAMGEARKAIIFAVANTIEWGVPSLFTRAADGHLFVINENNTLSNKTELVQTEAPWHVTDPAVIPDIIEFDEILRNLEKLNSCTSIEEISEVYSVLTLKGLEETNVALLRTFNRISQNVRAALEQESNYNQRLSLSSIEDNLDKLIRELNSSKLKYADLFYLLAIKWRDIVHVYQSVLAIEIKLDGEVENPYIIGVPLTSQQEIFVGRTDIGNRVENLLLNRQRPPLLLYGQRRMGKTSLLNNLGRLLPSTIVPLVVDLQGPTSSARDITGFLYNIANGISISAESKRGIIIQRLTRDALIVDPFTVFNEWLDEIEHSIGDNIALLVLDEFESLDSAIKRGRYDAEDVFGMLRHLIQHRTKFKVLLAGSHTLAEYHHWSSYLINVQTVHINYLKEDEARQLIEHPTNNFSLRYKANASQRIIDLTRCHPFLVQLLCSELVALKNEQDPNARRLATLTDIEAAVPDALEHGSMFFADIERNQVNDAGRTVLRTLAACGEGGIASRAQLAQSCPDAIDETLKLLQQRELIEPVEGGYRFQVELIRRWFAQ